MTLEVDTEALRAHANDVQHFADQIDGALDAGATTAMADDAFGLLCSFLVPGLRDVQLSGVRTLSASSRVTTGISSGIRSCVSTYEAVDALVEHNFNSLAETLSS